MFDVVFMVAVESWAVLGEMAPYLLFGFLVAGLLSVLISPGLVERHLGGSGGWPIVKASVFGVPLPLCSCGVIPVAASLRRHGASRGATTSFLLSTPQTGVDSIAVTFSLLGPVFAVFRPVVAFLSGLIGGSVVGLVESDGRTESESSMACDAPCCSGDEGHGRFSGALRYGFITLPRDLARPLLVGLVIAGVLSALAPDDFFASLLGTGIGAMFVMMLLGIPIYVCATASVPIAAALIAKGISPGAALVFLMTGPATNAATISTIWKLMGRRTTFAYLATVAFTALAAGLAMDYVFAVQGVSATAGMPWMMPGFVENASAVMLLVILGAALIPASHGHVHRLPSDAKTTTLTISGMTCSHCAETVQRALRECVGVDSVQVDRKKGQAFVTGTDFDIISLRRAVERAGYEAAVASQPAYSGDE